MSTLSRTRKQRKLTKNALRELMQKDQAAQWNSGRSDYSYFLLYTTLGIFGATSLTALAGAIATGGIQFYALVPVVLGFGPMILSERIVFLSRLRRGKISPSGSTIDLGKLNAEPIERRNG